MRKLIAIGVGFLVAISVAVAGPRGPHWRGSGGWAPDGAYGRMFDPKAIVTVSGKITGFQKLAPMRGMGAGIHLLVQTRAGIVDVHLGPAWYVEAQDADLRVGDRIEVRGSRIQLGTRSAIVAMTVRRGDDVLVLRDDDGIPRWAGWRRGRPPRS